MYISKKIFARVVFALIIIIPISFVEYKYWTSDFSHKTVVTASGIISEKTESYYTCGTKGRDTCYSRYFKIDNEYHKVNLTTYNTNKVGDTVTLTKKEISDSEEYKFFHYFGIAFFIILIFLYCFVVLVKWAEFLD